MKTKVIAVTMTILFLVACSQPTSGKDKKVDIKFDGKWAWEQNNDSQVFNVEITKNNAEYVGSYCAVYMSENRIDCSDDDSPSFKFKDEGKKEVVVEFLSYYSDSKGKAKLIYNEGKINWEIVEQPEGGSYCPVKAVLIPSKE